MRSVAAIRDGAADADEPETREGRDHALPRVTDVLGADFPTVEQLGQVLQAVPESGKEARDAEAEQGDPGRIREYAGQPFRRMDHGRIGNVGKRVSCSLVYYYGRML